MRAQSTLAEKVSCTGIGLHTGARVELTLHPARAHSGIVFVRRDHASLVEIRALSTAVVSTFHATTIADRENPEVRVTTVEHLLSALYALGVDNVRVELDGPEVPAMDGSAAPFVALIREAGVYAQKEPCSEIVIEREIEVVDGSRRIRVEPAPCLQLSYAIDFEHPAIGHQVFHTSSIDEHCFASELAPARTFGFLHEVSALLQAGFARGGSLANTVVLDDERVLNTDGLRWPDEFVRHKALDLLGDLALLGAPLRGRVHVERGGHALHQMLLQEIRTNPDAWSGSN